MTADHDTATTGRPATSGLPPALFDATDYTQPPDLIDPGAVACPTCGAPVDRPCRRLRGIAHQARIAQARHAAGVADEPTLTLLGRETP